MSRTVAFGITSLKSPVDIILFVRTRPSSYVPFLFQVQISTISNLDICSPRRFHKMMRLRLPKKRSIGFSFSAGRNLYFVQGPLAF